MPFQQNVQITQAPGVEGDFASYNPRSTVLAGPGGLVAGANGVIVGHFAWTVASTVDADGAPAIVNSTGTGPVAGFVHREQQALITVYLAETSMVIPAGFGVTLHNTGDFWVRNAGAAAVTVGLKAFAVLATGAVSFAAAGATVAGAIETKWIAESAGAVGELIKMSSTPAG